MLVKASGGVGDYKGAVGVIEGGASRIGASKGVAIVKGMMTKSGREGTGTMTEKEKGGGGY